MVKTIIQYITQVEYDSETGASRLVKSFSKLLGKGNGAKKPKAKQVQLIAPKIEQEEM